MDLGAIAFLGFMLVILIGLTSFLVTGKPRHEPDVRIHHGPVAFAGILGFLGAYAIFGNFGAAILAAAVVGAFTYGVCVWYEATLHADCAGRKKPHSYSYTSRSGIHQNPSSDPQIQIKQGPRTS